MNEVAKIVFFCYVDVAFTTINTAVMLEISLSLK